MSEEDADVDRAARAMANSQEDGTAAPFSGIRIKCFERATRARSIRTLTAFLATYCDLGGRLDGWVVTLPKVTRIEQVDAMVETCARLEQGLGLEEGSLRFEIQIETTQSILGADGTAPVARMVHAGGTRLTGLHFGTYDYSASCGIAAEYQALDHPATDYAKVVMQAAAAGTGVRLSDGSTNILPIGKAEGRRSRVGQPLPPGAALAGAWLLPGLGPASRAAPDPVRRDLRVLPRRAAARRWSGWPPTPSTRPTGSPTSRPPRARWRRTSSAASRAAPSTRPRSSPARVSGPINSSN